MKAKDAEENLYNFINDTPLKTPISQFLAADTSEDSNLWLNKTKEALGGIPLGIAFDLFGDATKAALGKLKTEPVETYLQGLKKAKDAPEELQEELLREAGEAVAESTEKAQKLLKAAVEEEVGGRITDARRLLKAAPDPSKEGFIDIEITQAPIRAGGDVDPDWNVKRLEALEEEMVVLEEYRNALSGMEVGEDEFDAIGELDETLFQLQDEVEATLVNLNPQTSNRGADISEQIKALDDTIRELSSIEVPEQAAADVAEGAVQGGEDIVSKMSQALDKVPAEGTFGGDKVYIASLYDSLDDPGMTLDEFKEELLKLTKQGKVELSRGDLGVTRMAQPDIFNRSQMVHPEAEAHYHFVRRESIRESIAKNTQIADTTTRFASKETDPELLGGLTYKTASTDKPLVTLDVDQVIADLEKNKAMEGLIPGRAENIKGVIDTLLESGEPLEAPRLVYSDKKGFDVVDGRSRLNELKRRGIKQVQAVVEDLDNSKLDTDTPSVNPNTERVQRQLEILKERRAQLEQEMSGLLDPSRTSYDPSRPTSRVLEAPEELTIEPTPERSPNIIGGEGVGRQESILPNDGPGAVPDRAPNLISGEGVGRREPVGDPTARKYRTKTEIKQDVAFAQVEARVKPEAPSKAIQDPRASKGTKTPKKGSKASMDLSDADKEALKNAKVIDKGPTKVSQEVAKKVGIDVDKLGKNFMNVQSGKDVDRFVNMDKLSSNEEMSDMIKQAMEALPNNQLLDDMPDAKVLKDASNVFNAVRYLSDKEGNALLKAYARNAGNLPSANVVVRMLVNDMAQQILDVSKTLPQKPISKMNIAEFAQQADLAAKLSRFDNFLRMNKNLGKLTAQGLRARGLDASDAAIGAASKKMDYDALMKGAKEMTEDPDTYREELLRLLKTPDGRKKFEKMVTDLKNGKSLEDTLNTMKSNRFLMFGKNANKFAQAVRMNGILSGTRTNLANVLGNGIMTLYAPATQVAGAMLDLPYQRLRGNAVAEQMDRQVFQEAVGALGSIHQYIGDSLRMAGRAFKKGAPILTEDDAFAGEIAEQTFDMMNPQSGSPAMDILFKTLSMPSRLLVTGDEFFKQLNYRSNVHGKAYALGMDKGLKGKKLQEYVTRIVDNSFQVVDETTGVQGLGLDTQSIEYAEYATFQQAITSENSRIRFNIVKSLEHLRKLPGGDALIPLFVPFVTSPANIMAYSARNSPLAVVSKGWQVDIAAGGARAARARGEFAMGSMALMGIVNLGLQGRLTGRPPADPQERALWYEQKKQPYSLKVGKNKWVSFQRAEPFAAHLSVVADMVESVSRASKQDETTALETMGYLTGAFVAAVKNQTFFEGISQFFEIAEAIGSEDSRNNGKVSTVASQLATTMMPYSSLLNEQRRARDNTLREATTLVDKFRERIPGLSTSLPARRSWLTGKPLTYSSNPVMNLFPMSTETNDPLIKQMLKYNTPLTPPDEKVGGVELTPDQYSKLLELTGTIEIEGKTQYQALLDVFNSFDTSVLDGELDYLKSNDEYARSTPLYVELSKTRAKYNKAAESALVQAYPDLLEGVRKVLIEKGNVKEGMYWMNAPLFEEQRGQYADDEKVQAQIEKTRVDSNKKLKKLIEDPGPVLTDVQ